MVNRFFTIPVNLRRKFLSKKMLNLNHKNLNVWKESIEFVKDIYKLTENFPKTEIFGITNQLRRASVSVPSNIAEGSARKSKNERSRFFEISRSSIVEIDTQLEISMALEFITHNQIEAIDKNMCKLFAMMSGLIEKSR